MKKKLWSKQTPEGPRWLRLSSDGQLTVTAPDEDKSWPATGHPTRKWSLRAAEEYAALCGFSAITSKESK